MTTEQRVVNLIRYPVELRQVVLNGHTINYAKIGQEGPPLLLLHGANFGWGVWYPNLDALAENYQVYALDLPGAGRSSTIDYAQLDLEKDLLGVVENFLQHLNLTNVSVIGCSAGGWIALRLALTYPDRISRVVIENTVGLADYMGLNDKVIGFYPLAQFIVRWILNPVRSNPRVEQFLRSIFSDRKLTLEPAFIEYFYETMARSHNLLFISRMTALHKDFLLHERLTEIRVPTLIVWGEDDKIMPLEKNKDAFSLIPQSSVVIMKHAGHIPSLERPDAFNQVVQEFLASDQETPSYRGGITQPVSDQSLVRV